MAEEVKETREDFEAQLEESLNKASTNEDAVWNRLEQIKAVLKNTLLKSSCSL